MLKIIPNQVHHHQHQQHQRDLCHQRKSQKTADLRSINKNQEIYCDWLSVHCVRVRSGPGYENLELRQCQHPGGTCKKLVHHLCAINWGQNKGVTNDIGYTCKEHTPAYIEKSRQFTPRIEASENGFDLSDNN